MIVFSFEYLYKCTFPYHYLSHQHLKLYQFYNQCNDWSKCHNHKLTIYIIIHTPLRFIFWTGSPNDSSWLLYKDKIVSEKRNNKFNYFIFSFPKQTYIQSCMLWLARTLKRFSSSRITFENKPVFLLLCSKCFMSVRKESIFPQKITPPSSTPNLLSDTNL